MENVKLVSTSVIFGGTRYSVIIDNEVFCNTDSDDDGLALGIAIARLQLQQKMEGKQNGETL